jgi:aspartyl-tRNA(Asn)/glutamyl-tRNA(Gln) amidotransferase subunit A
MKAMSETFYQLPGSTDKTKPYRIGVPIEYNVAELAPEVRNAWAQVLKTFREAGHEVVPVSLPTTKHALSAYYVLAPAEASSNLAKYDGVRYGSRYEGADGAEGVLFSKTRGYGFGSEVKRRILLGSYTLSADAVDNYFIQAQKVRRLVQQDFDRVFRYPNVLHQRCKIESFGEDGVDILICPTAPTLPPTWKEIKLQTPLQQYINDVFTVPASLAGLPAISIPFPSANNTKGPAIGIQIIGQFGADELVLDMAKEAEKYQKQDFPN